MKIALTTIGCKLNQSEILDLKQNLQDAGYILVDKDKPHDLHIFNACSVTHGAEQITRQKIREIKRKNPESQIFVMGCLNKGIPEISKIFKNSQQVIKFIKSNYKLEKYQNSEFKIQNLKSRALIKIQSGCNFSCSYCIIHKFRRKSQSIPLNKIIKKIKEKEKQGFKEIVLVGQNILQYQSHTSRDLRMTITSFTDLVKEILNKTSIPRIRFSSLDPRLVDTDFLNLLQEQRICPHLHLSLQSGSNKILKLMNRGYTTSQYLKIVNKAQKINPLTSITTDIIIGFPGETDDDFQDTLNFVKKIDFLKIHIFPYSARSETPAAEFKDKITSQIKKERYQKLNTLAQKQKAKFLNKIKGKELPVLFEGQRDNIWQGYTPNYIQVKKKSPENLCNKIFLHKI